jgi:hypothetical protein
MGRMTLTLQKSNDVLCLGRGARKLWIRKVTNGVAEHRCRFGNPQQRATWVESKSKRVEPTSSRSHPQRR